MRPWTIVNSFVHNVYIHPKLNLGNFTCTFGDKFVLLDMLDTIVLPAFQSGYTRTHGSATYFLLGATLIKYGDNELVLAERLIKDTKVESDQFVSGGNIAIIRHHQAYMSRTISTL